MKYAKAIAALLGGLTPAALVGILTVFHVHVNPELVAEVYTAGAPILAGVFTAGGPANKAAASVDQAAAREAATFVGKIEAAAPAVAQVAAKVETVAPVVEQIASAVEHVPTPDALHN